VLTTHWNLADARAAVYGDIAKQLFLNANTRGFFNETILYKKLCQAEVPSAASAHCQRSFIFVQAVFTHSKPAHQLGFLHSTVFVYLSTFLAADVAYRNNTTVFVDVFINRMPPSVQKMLRIICYLLSLAFMTGMTYYGAILFVKSWARPFQCIPGFSYSWVTLSVPVGFGLMVITTLRKMYYDFVCHEQPPVMDIIGERKKKQQEEKEK
jgi:TRAP-type C4-dicarboxylate transport system permease small subunit